MKKTNVNIIYAFANILLVLLIIDLDEYL